MGYMGGTVVWCGQYEDPYACGKGLHVEKTLLRVGKPTPQTQAAKTRMPGPFIPLRDMVSSSSRAPLLPAYPPPPA